MVTWIIQNIQEIIQNTIHDIHVAQENIRIRNGGDTYPYPIIMLEQSEVIGYFRDYNYNQHRADHFCVPFMTGLRLSDQEIHDFKLDMIEDFEDGYDGYEYRYHPEVIYLIDSLLLWLDGSDGTRPDITPSEKHIVCIRIALWSFFGYSIIMWFYAYIADLHPTLLGFPPHSERTPEEQFWNSIDQRRNYYDIQILVLNERLQDPDDWSDSFGPSVESQKQELLEKRAALDEEVKEYIKQIKAAEKQKAREAQEALDKQKVDSELSGPLNPATDDSQVKVDSELSGSPNPAIDDSQVKENKT